MADVNNLLKRIREKPGMYLGSPSVSALFMFLEGYSTAQADLNIPLSEQDKEFREFQRWLQKRENITTSASWAKIILLNSPDEEYAFARFFDLYDEFLSHSKSIEAK
jgi:hypothetical protein